MDRYNKLIDYVKTTCWIDDTDTDVIIKQAHKVYNEMIKDKTKEKILYRLCGQTGSGKTTQLLASVEKVISEAGFNPVILGVRSCAEAHPKYEEFKNNFPVGELREKTNGFALKCMSYVLKLLIENGYMILLDITLLDPIFEEFVLSLLTQYNYDVKYHILAVNKRISDDFILKRFNQSGRVIYKSSSDYFYEILPVGLKYICDNDKTNDCFVWNAFDIEPVYSGKISNCYEQFIKSQNEIKEFVYNEETLRNSKYEIIKKHL
jgi:hypothetical protein